MEKFDSYKEYQWMDVQDDVVTVGLFEDELENMGQIIRVTLPQEDESVGSEEICGEIYTSEGAVNLYSPIEGVVVEVNSALSENPSLIHEDPNGEGWLYKVRANDPDELDALLYDDEELDEDMDEDDEDLDEELDEDDYDDFDEDYDDEDDEDDDR